MSNISGKTPIKDFQSAQLDNQTQKHVVKNILIYALEIGFAASLLRGLFFVAKLFALPSYTFHWGTVGFLVIITIAYTIPYTIATAIILFIIRKIKEAV
jgi:hypothetical protein